MADAVIGSVAWELDLDDKKFKKGLSNAQGEIKGFGSSIEQAADGSKVFAAGLAAVGTGLVAFGAQSVKAFNESEQVTARLTKLILNQTGATQKNVDALKDQASAMQRVTTYGDDLVMVAQSQLATFDLSSDSIQKIIPGFLDMMAAERGASVSMEEMKNQANGLGKALVGQTDMLVKQGFQFTELQKQILKTGNEQERLQVISDVMGKTYGGLAATLRDTFQGQMIAAKNTFGDFMELIGQGISNKLKPLIAAINEWAASMGGPEGIMKRLTELAREWQDWLPVIIGLILGGLTPALYAAAAGMWALFAPLAPFLAIGAAVGLAVKLLIEHFGGWNNTVKALQPTLDTLKNVLKPIYEALGLLWNTITGQLIPALKDLWNQVEPVLLPVLKALATVFGVTIVAALLIVIHTLTLIIDVFTKIIENTTKVIDSFQNMVNRIINILKPVSSGIIDSFKGAFDWIKEQSVSVGESLQKLNPFHRESPSLVDNVIRGMDVIRDQFTSLGNVTMPTATIAAGVTSTSSVNNFTFNVSEKADWAYGIDLIKRELGMSGLQAAAGIS